MEIVAKSVLFSAEGELEGIFEEFIEMSCLDFVPSVVGQSRLLSLLGITLSNMIYMYKII